MTALLGIDQSSRPPPSWGALTARGVRFANHYVADRDPDRDLDLANPATWPPKCLRPWEVRTYIDAGIAMVTNWETSATAMLGGAARGAEAAGNAARMALACGAPSDVVIYFSADWDVTATEYANGVRPFLAAAHRVLGVNRRARRRAALYGGLRPISWAFADGLIDYGWQSAAWSANQTQTLWSARAQIRQYPDAHPGSPEGAYHIWIDGVECDIDRAVAIDYGQWPYKEADMPLDANDLDSIKTAVRQVLNEGTAAGQTSWAKTEQAVLATVQSLVNLARAGQSYAADTRSELLGAVKAMPAPETPEQAQATAGKLAALIAQLGVDGVSVDAWLDALGHRLTDEPTPAP